MLTKEKNIAPNHNSFLFPNYVGRKIAIKFKKKKAIFSRHPTFSGVCFHLRPKKGTPVSNMRKKEKDNFDLFILLTTLKVITVTLGNLCKGLCGSISNECEKKGAEIEFT